MSTAASQKQQSQFLGMGQPWFYILAGGIAVAVAAPHFLRSARKIMLDPLSPAAGLFVFSLINVVLAVFLFFTPGSNYALVSVCLSLLTAASIGTPEFAANSKLFAGAYLLWMIVLTGIFGSGGNGLLGVQSLFMCQMAYPGATDLMCKSGWITFTLFCSFFVIGLNFLSTLLLFGNAFSGEDGEQDSIVHPTDDAPRASSYGTAAGNYHRVGDY